MDLVVDHPCAGFVTFLRSGGEGVGQFIELLAFTFELLRALPHRGLGFGRRIVGVGGERVKGCVAPAVQFIGEAGELVGAVAVVRNITPIGSKLRSMALKAS